MKKLLFFTIPLLFGTYIKAQDVSPIAPYERITPLTNKYNGKKIKWVMYKLATKEYIIITKNKGGGATLNKAQAAAAGILPPLPIVSTHFIDSTLKLGICSKIPLTIPLENDLISDEISVSRDSENEKYTFCALASDTVNAFSVIKKTGDTVIKYQFIAKYLPDSFYKEPIVSFGKVTGSIATIDFLKQQKNIYVEDGYTIDSGYIHLADYTITHPFFKTIKLTSTSLKEVTPFLDSLKKESVIAGRFWLKNRKGIGVYTNMLSMKLGYKIANDSGKVLPFAKFGYIKFPRALYTTAKAQKSLWISEGYRLVSADISFAGRNFDNLPTARIVENSFMPIRHLLNRCLPGSSIVIDNIQLKDRNGNIIKVDGMAIQLH